MSNSPSPASDVTAQKAQLQSFIGLCEIVARLRAPNGCPWDREQTIESLLPNLLEEAYEIASAVHAGDDQNLCEELGDLILLAVMQARIAEENRRFTIVNVLEEVTEKLVRRHPHIFGKSDVRDTAGVIKQWEAIKREEKTDSSTHYLANIPTALPALMRAQKAQKKAARVNFDWKDISDVVAKVDEELTEAKGAIASGNSTAVLNEIGDLLFAVVNLARKSGLDAETALQEATDKFVGRFSKVEDELRRQGKELGEADLGELDVLWEAVKLKERQILPRS